MATWRTGPEVQPFARMSREPVRLLETLTGPELALAVPFLRITRVDPTTGRPLFEGGVRPMVFDMVEPPRFDDPGSAFMERPLVSLLSARVTAEPLIGDQYFRSIDLSFRVHRPELIFDRDSDVEWSKLFFEGESFVLEYGWNADPRDVRNELLNGLGILDERSGQVVPARNSILFNVKNYDIDLQPNGQADVTFHANENGDRAFREARFRDVAAHAWWTGVPDEETALERRSAGQVASIKGRYDGTLKGLLDRVRRFPVQGRGELYRMGDILDFVVAPLIEHACSAFGYTGGVELFCGNFNRRAGSQAEGDGGETMSERSIADFQVSAKDFRSFLAQQLATGQLITLSNFIATVIGSINADESWAPATTVDRRKPHVVLRGREVELPDGRRRYVVQLFDRLQLDDAFLSLERIPPERQTREEVFRRLDDAGVPIVELGRAYSYILGARFQLQPDAALQTVQFENANRARKDRVQLAHQPDTVTRRGQGLQHSEIVPLSILQGELQMVGNFVFENLGPVWMEYFGASPISGKYVVLRKTDEIGPGSFRTSVEVIGDGIDPLNTRKRLTDAEFAQQEQDSAQATAERRRTR